jgi:prephenate dehydratase
MNCFSTHHCRMTISIAYLGPEGTYSQLAALAYSFELEKQHHQSVELIAFPSISKAMQATTDGETDLTLVPVENSIEGGVTTTLDNLWKLKRLRIHRALVMPIWHNLLSQANNLADIEVVYSHPQALAQCQIWLENNLPNVKLIPTSSTVEALQHLLDSPKVAAIASGWAALLHNVPILAKNINDYLDNCTKFWVLGIDVPHHGAYTSLVFSLPVNAPGALLKPLKIFASYSINLSRIESRPTKRSLGDYLFFVDLETGINDSSCQQALHALSNCVETVINLGSYNLTTVDAALAATQATRKITSN